MSHAISHSIMPWQFGELGLTEDGGNRVIKYADAINDGVSFDGLVCANNILIDTHWQASPNDGT